MFGTVLPGVPPRATAPAARHLLTAAFAADQSGLTTLARLFLIAALICVPFGIWLHRRGRRGREPMPARSRVPGPDQGTGPATGTAGGPGGDPGPNPPGRTGAGPTDLRHQLARVEAFAERPDRHRRADPDDAGGPVDESAELVVVVGEEPRLDGVSVTPTIAVALIRDTARQCGLTVSSGVEGSGTEALVITRSDA